MPTRPDDATESLAGSFAHTTVADALADVDLALAVQADDTPLWERLPRLREHRKLSRSLLSRRTASSGDQGVSEETIKRLELPPDNRHHRRASADVIAKLAGALEVPPETFPEYTLAKVRALFDERTMPLREAMQNSTDAVLARDDAADLLVKDKDGDTVAFIQVRLFADFGEGGEHFRSELAHQLERASTENTEIVFVAAPFAAMTPEQRRQAARDAALRTTRQRRERTGSAPERPGEATEPQPEQPEEAREAGRAPRGGRRRSS